MEATDILSREHRLIERGLGVARAMAQALRAGQAVSPDDVQELVEFLRGFADHHHHRKEEDILFPWMEAQGMASSYGPLACMRAEHESGRELVRLAEENVPALPSSAPAVAGALEAFAGHLETHIMKEDQILFPMACQLGDGDSELLPAYQAAIPDAAAIEARYTASIERLLERYPASCAAAPAPAPMPSAGTPV